MGRIGYKHTPEALKKISEASKKRIKTEEYKRKVSETLKGHPVSEETKRKLSEKNKGRKRKKETIEKIKESWKNRTPEQKKETRRLKSEIVKQQYKLGIRKTSLGRKLNEETKKKMREAHMNKTIEEKQKIAKRMVETRRRNDGFKFSEEHKKKISISNKGKIRSKETKEKIRKAKFEYIKKCEGIAFPTLGKNEKKILDNFAQKLGYKVLRQYYVSGFFVDGYIPELNLCVEVDEEHHQTPNIKERDLERQKRIQEKLNCHFLRIQDNWRYKNE